MANPSSTRTASAIRAEHEADDRTGSTLKTTREGEFVLMSFVPQRVYFAYPINGKTLAATGFDPAKVLKDAQAAQS